MPELTEIQRWWAEDLPEERPEIVSNYKACYPQYAEGIPFPEVVTPDTVRWYKPDDEKWINYNVAPQNLITALRSCWLPEEPVDEVNEETGETHECPNCEYTAKSSVGLKIHRSLRGHN